MLGIPKELVWRQPFPGPGLGVRILGEITADKIRVLQEADWVLRDEMAKNGYEKGVAQFFCVLPLCQDGGRDGRSSHLRSPGGHSCPLPRMTL